MTQVLIDREVLEHTLRDGMPRIADIPLIRAAIEAKPSSREMTVLDVADDDSLRFIQRVLESNAPEQDKADALRMVRDIRLRIRNDHVEAKPQEPVAWQPIETAPKDGTEILVHTKYETFYVVSYDSLFSAPWRVRNDEGLSEAVPTHWMPLPSAPAEHAQQVPLADADKDQRIAELERIDLWHRAAIEGYTQQTKALESQLTAANEARQKAEKDAAIGFALLGEATLISSVFDKIMSTRTIAIDDPHYDLFAWGWKAALAAIAQGKENGNG